MGTVGKNTEEQFGNIVVIYKSS
uniref:Upstream ORF n=1 Tax=Homo sapiens TaxID=9606 RepID=Q96P08_HUMAN|nr:upstream ORF [Homo sapiens]